MTVLVHLYELQNEWLLWRGGVSVYQLLVSPVRVALQVIDIRLPGDRYRHRYRSSQEQRKYQPLVANWIKGLSGSWVAKLIGWMESRYALLVDVPGSLGSYVHSISLFYYLSKLSI